MTKKESINIQIHKYNGNNIRYIIENIENRIYNNRNIGEQWHYITNTALYNTFISCNTGNTQREIVVPSCLGCTGQIK